MPHSRFEDIGYRFHVTGDERGESSDSESDSVEELAFRFHVAGDEKIEPSDSESESGKSPDLMTHRVVSNDAPAPFSTTFEEEIAREASNSQATKVPTPTTVYR